MTKLPPCLNVQNLTSSIMLLLTTSVMPKDYVKRVSVLGNKGDFFICLFEQKEEIIFLIAYIYLIYLWLIFIQFESCILIEIMSILRQIKQDELCEKL